jgi:hypothetical protein
METVINESLKQFLDNPWILGMLFISTELFAHSLYEDDTIQRLMDNDLLRIVYWTVLIFLTTKSLYSSIIISFVVVLGFRLLKIYKERQ